MKRKKRTRGLPKGKTTRAVKQMSMSEEKEKNTRAVKRKEHESSRRKEHEGSRKERTREQLKGKNMRAV